MPGPWRRIDRCFSIDKPYLFQSQPRCPAPGDDITLCMKTFSLHVSISTEMPGPWRPRVPSPPSVRFVSFNLNRDARPLATCRYCPRHPALSMFQSQPRCQAPGDAEHGLEAAAGMLVSISTEMPGPWRHYDWNIHWA